MARPMMASDFREHRLMLSIYHCQFFSLLFSYCKALVYYFPPLSWWRKLYFYFIVELTQDLILHFLQELMIAWGSCTMAPGNGFFHLQRKSLYRKDWIYWINNVIIDWFKCHGLILNLKISNTRLLGWWSIDEGSREEQARLFHQADSGLVLFYFYYCICKCTICKCYKCTLFAYVIGWQIIPPPPLPSPSPFF